MTPDGRARMCDTADRTTHASSREGDVAVVRCDRAGRWRLERADGTSSALVLSTAVEEALDLEAAGGTVHTGRSGGAQFDRCIQKARTAHR